MNGRVVAISIVKKGINIDEHWFNPEDNVWQFCKNLQKGDTVNYEVDEERGQLIFIELVKKTETKPTTQDTSKQIRRMNCITNAIALINIQQDPSLANIKNVIDVAREFEKYVEGD